jgi:hypothetical protein
MKHRSTTEEVEETLCMVKKLALEIPKRSDLVHEVAKRKGITRQQARTYVRKALNENVFVLTEIERLAHEKSYEINYFLSWAARYIEDRTVLNRMLRFKFEMTRDEAAILIEEFENNEGGIGKDAAIRHKHRRKEAWGIFNLKISRKEWPKASFFLCTDCDERAQHYHHPNYAYPLWVEPLCKKCHARVHIIYEQRLL